MIHYYSAEEYPILRKECHFNECIVGMIFYTSIHAGDCQFNLMYIWNGEYPQ